MLGTRENHIKAIEYSVVILIIAFAAVWSISFLGVARIEFSDSLAKFVNFIGTIGTLLLTLALVFLYEQQTTISMKQQNVQENQEELMEANHRPLLDVNSILPGIKPNKENSEISNELFIEFVNVGNGICYLPSLLVNLDFDDDELEPVENAVSLRPFPGNESMGKTFSDLRMSIPPNGEGYFFRGNLVGAVKRNEEIITKDIIEIIPEIFESGNDFVDIEISVEIKDIYNDTTEIPLISLPIYRENAYEQGSFDIDNYLMLFLSATRSLTAPKDLERSHMEMEFDESRLTFPSDIHISDKSAVLFIRMMELSIDFFMEDTGLSEVDSIKELDSEELRDMLPDDFLEFIDENRE